MTSRRTSAAIAVLMLVALAAGAVVGWYSYGKSEQKVATRTEQAQTAKGAADQVADPVQAACAQNDSLARQLEARGVCAKADAAKAATDAIPVTGRRGATGLPGRGIASVTTTGCFANLRFTSGSPQRVGPFCGQDGATGRPGRSIESAITSGCFVQLTFTGGTTTRVGPFCGRDGTNGTDGTNGSDGSDGTNGRDAFPFGFTFTVPASPTDTTYTCRVQDPSVTAACAPN